MEKYDTEKDLGAIKVEAEMPIVVPKPKWKPFPGFSFLFDNPGPSLKPHKHLLKMSVEELDAPELEFYKALNTAVEKMDRDLVSTRFHFFPLPSSTYHVTVWDGLNLGNLQSLTSALIQENFGDYFKDAFKSSESIWPPLSDELEFGGCFQETGAVRFKFKNLRSRGNTVLVANLEPADQMSVDQLAAITRQREALDDRFLQACGKPLNSDLRPHVAIGYFADKNLAHEAHAQKLDEWRSLFRREAANRVIEFNSISLYAFTDMVTYFKAS